MQRWNFLEDRRIKQAALQLRLQPLSEARRTGRPTSVGTAAAYTCPYLWWLCGHLDAGLQDGDGEVWVGAGAEPEGKEGCGSSTCSCSTSLSKFGIQDRDRWQLARKTQCPGRRCWCGGNHSPCPLCPPTVPLVEGLV